MLCNRCKRELEELKESELIKIKKIDYDKLYNIEVRLENVVFPIIGVGLFIGILFTVYGLTSEYKMLPSIGYAINGIMHLIILMLILIKLNKYRNDLINIEEIK